MTPPGAGRRRQVAFFLGALALIAAALALWAQATGGFRVYVLGVPLSVRGALRPAVVAVVLALTALHLLNAWRSRAMTTVVFLLPRTAPWIASIAAMSVLVGGVRYGSKVAAASDVSGYVSQAQLWLEGSLTRPQPDVEAMPWPAADWTFAPLGYRPRDAGKTIVPTYSPGLPLLMAAATVVAGACGPYLIVPLCGALLVGATYSAGSRLSGRVVGLIAALALVASPTFLFMLVQPMSDVPAAAFWTLSMMFAARSGTRRDALLAGVASGIAIMIRPNLAPLAAAPALLILLTPEPDDSRSGMIRAALFAAGCAPFIATVAAIFNHLYGSPLRSGYGSLGETYGLSNIAPNLSRYPRWFFETQGPAVFAFLLTPLVAFVYGGAHRTRRLLYFLFVAGVLAGYLLYAFFEEWWYLRFVLPAFPFAFILGADAVGTIAGRIGPVVRGAALLVFAALVILSGATESAARHVGNLAGIERRYADAAHYVQTTLPPGAVVLAMQHSGSLAYYSDKLPLRYDWVAPDWIDRAIDHFRRGGRPVYVLLDDWEIPLFAERLRGQRASALVEAEALAVTADGRVKLFAVGARQGGGPPVRMPRTHGCLPPAESNLYRR